MRLPVALRRLLTDPAATHYEVLSVAPGWEQAETDTSRKQLARLLHPDRHPDDGTAHDFMARVNVAHAVLSDKAARKRYDASLLSTHVKCKACAGAGFTVKRKGFKSVLIETTCPSCQLRGWVRKGD